MAGMSGTPFRFLPLPHADSGGAADRRRGRLSPSGRARRNALCRRPLGQGADMDHDVLSERDRAAMLLVGTAHPSTPPPSHWSLTPSANQHAFAITPSPNPATTGVLNGVSRISTTDCVAVGSYANSGSTLGEKWDETSWYVTPNPGGVGSFLNGVSRARSTICVAAATTRTLHRSVDPKQTAMSTSSTRSLMGR
jgi:hypothetical protein